jgi:hypothetical protein
VAFGDIWYLELASVLTSLKFFIVTIGLDSARAGRPSDRATARGPARVAWVATNHHCDGVAFDSALVSRAIALLQGWVDCGRGPATRWSSRLLSLTGCICAAADTGEHDGDKHNAKRMRSARHSDLPWSGEWLKLYRQVGDCPQFHFDLPPPLRSRITGWLGSVGAAPVGLLPLGGNGAWTGLPFMIGVIPVPLTGLPPTAGLVSYVHLVLVQ